MHRSFSQAGLERPSVQKYVDIKLLYMSVEVSRALGAAVGLKCSEQRIDHSLSFATVGELFGKRPNAQKRKIRTLSVVLRRRPFNGSPLVYVHSCNGWILCSWPGGQCTKDVTRS